MAASRVDHPFIIFEDQKIGDAECNARANRLAGSPPFVADPANG